jgi:hypothetical protein
LFKKFSEFNSNTIKLRSDASDRQQSAIKDKTGLAIFNYSVKIDLLNKHFINLSGGPSENKHYCAEFIFESFKELKRNGVIKTDAKLFEFNKATADIIDKFIA